MNVRRPYRRVTPGKITPATRYFFAAVSGARRAPQTAIASLRLCRKPGQTCERRAALWSPSIAAAGADTTLGPCRWDRSWEHAAVDLVRHGGHRTTRRVEKIIHDSNQLDRVRSLASQRRRNEQGVGGIGAGGRRRFRCRDGPFVAGGAGAGALAVCDHFSDE